MKISYNSEFLHGYTSLVERRGETAQMLMDFGVIVLDPNNVYQDNSSIDERCYMLGSGSATVSVEGKNFEWQRDDRFEQAPWCISVPRTVEVTIRRKFFVLQHLIVKIFQSSILLRRTVKTKLGEQGPCRRPRLELYGQFLILIITPIQIWWLAKW